MVAEGGVGHCVFFREPRARRNDALCCLYELPTLTKATPRLEGPGPLHQLIEPLVGKAVRPGSWVVEYQVPARWSVTARVVLSVSGLAHFRRWRSAFTLLHRDPRRALSPARGT